jgi:hypothetical protein
MFVMRMIVLDVVIVPVRVLRSVEMRMFVGTFGRHFVGMRVDGSILVTVFRSRIGHLTYLRKIVLERLRRPAPKAFYALRPVVWWTEGAPRPGV